MQIERKFRLGRTYDYSDKPTKVEFLDVLTLDQFTQIEKFIIEIEHINQIKQLSNFVIANDQEIVSYLNSSLQELTIKSQSWNGVKRSDSEQVYLNINRLLLNYLSSFRTFIDHSEAFLKRKYGANSLEFEEFSNILSLFYDNSFAYRFFYKLRNYSQHVGLPLQNINFSSRYNRTNNNLQGSLKIVFQRDVLLSRYDSWSSALKRELQSLQEEFDLTPLLFEMTHNIEEIERNIQLICAEKIKTASDFISNLTKHLRNDEGEVFVAYDFKKKENGELASYSSLYIPFNLIDSLAD